MKLLENPEEKEEKKDMEVPKQEIPKEADTSEGQKDLQVTSQPKEEEEEEPVKVSVEQADSKQPEQQTEIQSQQPEKEEVEAETQLKDHEADPKESNENNTGVEAQENPEKIINPEIEDNSAADSKTAELNENP